MEKLETLKFNFNIMVNNKLCLLFFHLNLSYLNILFHNFLKLKYFLNKPKNVSNKHPINKPFPL